MKTKFSRKKLESKVGASQHTRCGTPHNPTMGSFFALFTDKYVVSMGNLFNHAYEV